jgi:cytochrome c-type biogenesis protein CcmH
MRRGLALVAVALTTALAAPAARAGDPSQTAAEISAGVMSPFCPGLTLQDCPSDAARRLRDRIERWVRGGASREQIMARLRRDYGPGIAAMPPAEGSGLLAWLVPAAAVLVGGAGAWWLARRWSAREQTDSVPEPSPEERRRLARELAQLRQEP